jgi:hypothetical protein
MKTKITKKRKLEIFDAFLAEVRKIGRRQIRKGVDAGDPLAQVRACCNVPRLRVCAVLRVK